MRTSERKPSITDFQIEEVLSQPIARDQVEVQVRATSYWGDPEVPEERGGEESHYRLELIQGQGRWQVLKTLTDDTTADLTHRDFSVIPRPLQPMI